MISNKVYLVGAGPGDPELLTLKAVKFIALADVIFYDYLVDERILTYAKTDAELISLGQPYTGRKIKQTEVNERMIAAAKSGQTVVRLKGGDPHIFGRLNEEMQSLLDASVPFEVVPGITSASAAAQVAGISLTDRRHASAVAFITGHLSYQHDPTLTPLDFGKFASFPGTLVFYMGVVTVKVWSAALLENGMNPQTPIVIIFNATFSNQKVVRTTLADAEQTVECEQLSSPCIVIVGETSVPLNSGK
ncbi:MAG: uroporphyrinogen-III C-methyltransferase [Planctomycetaceae bacterium]|jgi:uroporphyrinogen III methyltransferase/synthase|nr:uroporphyrinogen-III C-methyltransferase [Planctomycetaceae bacterium]